MCDEKDRLLVQVLPRSIKWHSVWGGAFSFCPFIPFLWGSSRGGNSNLIVSLLQMGTPGYTSSLSSHCPQCELQGPLPAHTLPHLPSSKVILTLGLDGGLRRSFHQAVVLQFKRAPATPAGLVKLQPTRPPALRVYDSADMRRRSRMCISNKFQGEADAAGPGTTP